MYQFTPEYEALFGAAAADAYAPTGGKLYKTKTIKSGRVLEAETCQVLGWADRQRAKAAMQSEKHREDVERINERNSWKRMRRLAEANFTGADLWLTLTYPDVTRAVSIERAQKDLTNYIARIKRWREKRGMEPIKYIYVIEGSEDESLKIHHHIIMSGMDRDAAEALWRKGRTKCEYLQPDDKGLEQVTRYMLKQPRARGIDGRLKKQKRWNSSRNLTQPVETESKSRISRRQAERIALTMDTDPSAAREIYERAYPGYRFVQLEVRWSTVVPGPYLYAQMIKDERSGRNGTEKGVAVLGVRGARGGMSCDVQGIHGVQGGGGRKARPAARRSGGKGSNHP